MKLIVLASLLAVAAAAAEPKAEPQGLTPKPDLLQHALVQPQLLSGQYYTPYQGQYDQYYKGYRPFETNSYYKGQYDPKYYAGQYDPKYYAGQYDPKYYAGQYDSKYYAGQYDPKYYAGQYDPKFYAGQYDAKYYAGQSDPKYYAGKYDPKYIGGQYDSSKYYRNQYQYDPKHYQHVPIVEQSSEVNPDGSFRYSYATADGQQAQAEGIVRKSEIDPQDDSNAVRGSYSYTAPDGTPVAYSYIADEHGFRVEGTHVPKTPEAIQRSLQYNTQYEQNPLEYQRYYKQFPTNQYAKVAPVQK